MWFVRNVSGLSLFLKENHSPPTHTPSHPPHTAQPCPGTTFDLTSVTLPFIDQTSLPIKKHCSKQGFYLIWSKDKNSQAQTGALVVFVATQKHGCECEQRCCVNKKCSTKHGHERNLKQPEFRARSSSSVMLLWLQNKTEQSLERCFWHQ